MDFWPTDDQLALAEGMRNFVSGRFPVDHLHGVEERDSVIDRDRSLDHKASQGVGHHREDHGR